jgi:hypothetical protein
MIDEQDLERRLRSTLQRKAEQVGGPALHTVEPSTSGGRRPLGLVLALAGMAAAVLVVVLVARTGSGPDRVVTAGPVPGATDAPLPGWLPPDLDVWAVSSAEQEQTSVVVLAEADSDRRIEILVRDEQRADVLALTGADPGGATTAPVLPGTAVISWGEVGRTFQAFGQGLDPVELAALVDQVSLVADGEAYTSASVPPGWALRETRREPPATTTSAQFFVGVPDGSEPDLIVTQSIAEAPGDGAGWSSASIYIPPDADGMVWTLPGDHDDSSSVSVIDRDGQAVTVRSSGPDRLSADQLRALVREIIDGPHDQLTSLRARARANVSATPVIASATTESAETIELHGTDDGRASAVCVTRVGITTCRPAGFGVVDVATVTTADDDGMATVYGATRAEPSFVTTELLGQPWVAETDGWYLFRIDPVAVGAMVMAGNHGVMTPYMTDSP